MTQVTAEEFFHFIKISEKELYENRSTWKNATRRYVDLFARHSNNNVFISFNLWAFLFRETWFVYRKMYLNALLLTFTSTLLFTSLFYVFVEQKKLVALSFAVVLFANYIFSGLYGSYLYIKLIKKKVIKARDKKEVGGCVEYNKQRAISWVGAMLTYFLWPTFSYISVIMISIIINPI